MSEPDPKCKSGSLEHATFRRADAEHKKVEELGKWRELAREVFDWLKTIFTTKE